MNFQETVSQIWEQYNQDLLAIGRQLIVVAIIIAAGKIVITLTKWLTRKAAGGKFKTDENLTSILQVVIKYGVIIICIIMILDTFGISTASLIALLGAAGVAIGFALKDTLSNIASGLVILFLQPFRKGDFIECGSVMGFVREMGLFATNLETPDGIFISVPNSSLWGVPLKNYSYNSQRRVEITVTIAYTDSVDSAFQVLKGVIAGESRFLKEPAPQVMVMSLGETGIGITLRAWVLGSNYWPVYWDQMKNVKEKIQDAGLTISLPRREIHLVENKKEDSLGDLPVKKEA